MFEELEKMSRKDCVAYMHVLRDKMTKIADFMPKMLGGDEVIRECMALRKYPDDSMFNVLKEVGMFKINGLMDIIPYASMMGITLDMNDMYMMGMTTEEKTYCVLSGLYTVPIRDIGGNVVAFVGWYPDVKKYRTTPSYGFSRDASFFNFDSYSDSMENWEGMTFLVEGIFDALALRSIGLPAVANMGLNMSAYKRAMLQRYNKVVSINDLDSAGRTVLPLEFNQKRRSVWRLPNGVYVRLPTTLTKEDGSPIKDIDDCINYYDMREALIEVSKKTGIVCMRE